MRAYARVLDGTQVAEMAQASEVTIEIEPGVHALRATIDGTGSPVLQLTATAGQDVHVTVRPAGGPWSALSQAATADGYLVLVAGRPKDVPAPTAR